jgi:hypothetical protein
MAGELMQCAVLSVNVETSSAVRNSCSIVGVSLCAEAGKAFYIPFRDEPAPDLLSPVKSKD